MTLVSLAKKNIKGNLNNYVIYFVSLIFSIIIYYTFVSLQFSEKIQDSIELSEAMDFMFMVSSAILILFIAIFVLYSNAFFMRRRKREVGLYSMLGLRKQTIGRMLFYENLLMGLFALVIGIILGTFLSKLFSMILIKLMGSTVEIDFSISLPAILQTCMVFMIIILFTSIQGYRLIYRFKLIELFHAEKKGEKAPESSFVSAIIGVILLALSYGLILREFPSELTGGYLLKNYGVAFIALVIGTHLFFRSVTIYLLKLAQKNRGRYYRGTNLIQVSQLLFRIKGNARTFTTIALLSAATISFFAATYSGYYGNEKSSREDVPFSFTHESKGEKVDAEIKEIIASDQEHPIQAQIDIPVLQATGEPSFSMDYELNPIKLISETTFNTAAQALGRDENIQVTKNEAVVIKPRLTKYTSSDFKGKNISLQLHDINNLELVSMVEGSILPFDYPDFFVIISDELFNGIAEKKSPTFYKAYEVEDEITARATSNKLNAMIKDDFQVNASFYTEYKEGKEGNALNLFIFGFLGLVFLAATGSTIYFRQLTDANETKGNYEILRKIGVSQKDILKTIRKQMLFVFGLPLTIGIIHSSVIMKFISNFLSNLIGASLIVPIITAMVAFVVIFISYYFLTVSTYNNIVNKMKY
ncbi:ABC transporter permease [Bacillus sp. Marseille-Q3570]|uniref:ABC transporter permease n=1 Tax=Bacillus sp. Marseille-Q3570 TaxID=2963522 RepID=UPI0021B7B6C3|nr:ABC transporter permease [Bacillus sp. Marseille-Q3570]